MTEYFIFETGIRNCAEHILVTLRVKNSKLERKYQDILIFKHLFNFQME